MKLFEPLDIPGMRIPNRIMVPAMVTHLCREDGVVTDETIERYVRYARGGTGLIVVEAMAVHQVKSGPLLRISDDAFVPGLRELARRVHDAGDAKVVPQIIHFLKVARTGWRQTVDMLAPEDIDRIVDEFGAQPRAHARPASTAPSSTRRTRTPCRRSSRAPTRAPTRTAARRSKAGCT